MSAQESYARHHFQALDLVHQVQEMLEDMPAPDDSINWGHVGDLGRIEALLHEILGDLE